MGAWVVGGSNPPHPTAGQAFKLRGRSPSKPGGWLKPSGQSGGGQAGGQFSFTSLNPGTPIIDTPIMNPFPPGWNLPAVPAPWESEFPGQQPIGGQPPVEDAAPAPNSTGITRLQVWQSWLDSVRSMLAQVPTGTPDFKGAEPGSYTWRDLYRGPALTEPNPETAVPIHLPPPWGPGPTKPTQPKPQQQFTFSGLGLR